MMQIIKFTSSDALKQLTAYFLAFAAFMFAFSVILFGEKLNAKLALLEVESLHRTVNAYEASAPDYDQHYYAR